MVSSVLTNQRQLHLQPNQIDLTSNNKTKSMYFTPRLLVSFLVLVVIPKNSYCAAQTIELGACSDFAVMAGSAVSCAGTSACRVMRGYLGISPGTSITGKWVVGRKFPRKQVKTTKSNACANDGLAAWKQGGSLSGTSLASGELGGKTFTPGVYRYSGALTISPASGKVYLDAKGNRNAKFIFYATTTLTTAARTQIVLKNGASPANVYWILGTAATLGADSILKGTLIAGSAITIGSNGRIRGRAIAQTAVTCASACYVQKL